MTRTIVTPAIRERIIALAREHKSNTEIAAALKVDGLQAPYVAAVLTKARREGFIIPYRLKGWADRAEQINAGITSIVVRIDVASLEYLHRAGDRRGIDPAYLAGVLLEAIARDRIVDAVLDDGVTT